MTSVSTQLASSKVVAPEKEAGRRPLRRLPGYVIAYIILLLGVVVSLFPYFLALTTALRPTHHLCSTGAWTLPHPVTFQNFIDVVVHSNFLGFVRHTLIFAPILTIGQPIFSTRA